MEKHLLRLSRFLEVAVVVVVDDVDVVDVVVVVVDIVLVVGIVVHPNQLSHESKARRNVLRNCQRKKSQEVKREVNCF